MLHKFSASPKVLREFSSQMDREIKPSRVAFELGISLTDLKRKAEELDLFGEVKGGTTRWAFKHHHVRILKLYLTALKKGLEKEQAKKVAKSLSKKVQDIYEKPAKLEYEIELDDERIKNLPKMRQQEIRMRIERAKKENNLLERFDVLLGFGGKISFLTRLLEEEIAEGFIKLSLIPMRKKGEDELDVEEIDKMLRRSQSKVTK